MPRYTVHFIAYTSVDVETDATDELEIATEANRQLDPNVGWEPDLMSIELEDEPYIH